MARFYNILCLLVPLKLVLSDFPQYHISTFAGTNVNTKDAFVEGGFAASEKLTAIRGVWSDTSEITYVSDSGNNKVRSILLDTSMTTFAGVGNSSWPTQAIAQSIILSGSDNNNAATNSVLYVPSGIFGDTVGNVYIANQGAPSVRKVIGSIGTMLTVAGTGIPSTVGTAVNGDNGPASSATLKAPNNIFVNTDGVLYIADNNNNKIRKVDSNNIITLVAGKGGVASTGMNGRATSAQFKGCYGVWQDTAGNLYVSENSGASVRFISAVTTFVTLFAGTGSAGLPADDGLRATSSPLQVAVSVWGDTNGILYVSQQYALRMVEISSTILVTAAGTGVGGYSGNGGEAVNAQVKDVMQVHGSASSNRLLFAETNNYVVRRLTSFTFSPTASPSTAPTLGPTVEPPTMEPTWEPTTATPTTVMPTQPTVSPSVEPTLTPTGLPSNPTFLPTVEPSTSPTMEPSGMPSNPTQLPSVIPSYTPTVEPSTALPTTPTVAPTTEPSEEPSVEPSQIPTEEPSRNPSPVPSGKPIGPSPRPSFKPTPLPSKRPTIGPSFVPTSPTVEPTIVPSARPTSIKPTVVPTTTAPSTPTVLPSVVPTHFPSLVPTSNFPSTIHPSTKPTLFMPSKVPTRMPTTRHPTHGPTMKPTGRFREFTFTTEICMHNVSAVRLSAADEDAIRATAACVMDVNIGSVSFVSQEYMGSDVPDTAANISHICAEVQTYANTLNFAYVKNSNATQVYAKLTQTIEASLVNGNFTKCLTASAEEYGSTSLTTAQSVTVSNSNYDLFELLTNDDYLSDQEVAGFGIFGVLFSFFIVSLSLSICSVMEEKGF